MAQSSNNPSYVYLFDSAGHDRRWGVWLALGITVFLHLGFVVLVPESLFIQPTTISNPNEEDVELEFIAPDKLDPELLRFVEASPDAPENKPDRTDQYSYRSTQAASDVATDDLLEAPTINGEEVDSQKIIQGDLSEASMVPSTAITQVNRGSGQGNEGGARAQTVAQSRPESQPMPAPDFIQQQPRVNEGLGSDLSQIGKGRAVFENTQPDAPINVTRRPAEVLAEEGLNDADGGGGSQTVTPQPRARPRLAPELLTGPLMKSRGSVANRGALSIDATFSEFGEYQQQFYAALQLGWYQEIEFFQPIDTGSSVAVRFTMYSDGRIDGVETVRSNASEIARVICETAITKRSPFRAWTQEMIEVFGNQRILTVRFRYR